LHREAGLLSKGRELTRPRRGRWRQIGWRIVAPAGEESPTDRLANLVRRQLASLEQYDKIDEILHSRVDAIRPRARIGMDLLSELLSPGDRQRSNRVEPGEAQEIVTHQHLRLTDHRVADTGVEMEPRILL